MEKSIDEQLRENQEREDRLLDILRQLDKHEDDAIADYQSDMKSLDTLSEGWKGAMAQSFSQNMETERSALYRQMRSLISRQRDDTRSALDKNRQEREALLADRRQTRFWLKPKAGLLRRC